MAMGMVNFASFELTVRRIAAEAIATGGGGGGADGTGGATRNVTRN
jgi:hypothetical protein